MPKYAVPNVDGTISVIHFNGDDPDGLRLTKWLFELSRTTDKLTHFDPEVHTRDAIAAGSIDGHRALSVLGQCEKEDLPTDRYFRSSWEWSDGEKVHVDMPKARTFHMNEIRKRRNQELWKKDADFMKALEAGDTSAQSNIAAEKQTLRDIPQTFDITTDVDTPERLKTKWPDGLPTELDEDKDKEI